MPNERFIANNNCTPGKWTHFHSYFYKDSSLSSSKFPCEIVNFCSCQWLVSGVGPELFHHQTSFFWILSIETKFGLYSHFPIDLALQTEYLVWCTNQSMKKCKLQIKIWLILTRLREDFSVRIHAEKSFRNPIKSNWNQIVYTIFRLI